MTEIKLDSYNFQTWLCFGNLKTSIKIAVSLGVLGLGFFYRFFSEDKLLF